MSSKNDSESFAKKRALQSTFQAVRVAFAQKKLAEKKLNEKPGIKVFRCIYGNLKFGASYDRINRDITSMHFDHVPVGNINHSKGTIKQAKDALGKALRNELRRKFKKPLMCTDRLRPVSALFDKMTHFGRTGQMQLAIAPLMGGKELLTAVFLDNYLVNPDENRYRDMIDAVIDTGNSYYD